MDTATDLVRWDMPFAEARDPSVSLITEQGGDAAMLIVAPLGIDRYPKYLVRFSKVIALLCYEEAFALDRGYRALSGIEPKCCAYLWTDSPWMESYRKGADVFEWKGMQHYLILGGDSVVELIASGQPRAERLDERRVIETKYEV
jgi:hypothetical protein